MRADILLGPDIGLQTNSPSLKLEIEVSEELITSPSPDDLITNGLEITSISQDPHDTKLYHVVTSVRTDSNADYCSAVKSIEVPSDTITDLVGNGNTESSSFEWTYVVFFEDLFFFSLILPPRESQLHHPNIKRISFLFTN